MSVDSLTTHPTASHHVDVTPEPSFEQILVHDFNYLVLHFFFGGFCVFKMVAETKRFQQILLCLLPLHTHSLQIFHPRAVASNSLAGQHSLSSMTLSACSTQDKCFSFGRRCGQGTGTRMMREGDGAGSADKIDEEVRTFMARKALDRRARSCSEPLARGWYVTASLI